MADNNRFKNDQGQRYTRRLFLEASYGFNDKSPVLYTLKDKDYEGYPSLYRLYLEEEDPTELSFARKYFDGYDHWLMISEAQWFKPIIDAWRKELDLVIQKKTLQNILSIAQDKTHKNYLEANKLLLSQPWRARKGQKSPVRGRPTNDEVIGKLKEVAAEEKALSLDYQRMSQVYED